ncbi:MAG: hypothetical protein CL608_00935 [Anaerolineaceae bacterium]|nr:hypothetical protein [Anaerolineaceae bacterium]
MTDQIKSPDLQANESLLEELFSDVKKWEGSLAGGEKLDEGGAALHSLKETKVQFGNPRANLVAITAEQLHGSGIELSSIQKQQLESTHDFYFMTMTVDMRPQPGSHFSALACELDFGPKGANEPIVQSIFPQTSWKNVMSFGGGMNLGLDADLNWKVGVDASKLSELTDKAPELSANLENKNDMKSHIVLQDFSYDLGRFDIAAYGKDNSECYWYIQNADLQQTLTIKFSVVFKVPTGTEEFTLTGKAWAEPSMSWLTANVRNVFGSLAEKFQNLFRRRDDAASDLARGAAEKWTLPLPRQN